MPRRNRKTRKKEGVMYETDIQSAFVSWKQSTIELQDEHYLKEALHFIHSVPNGFYRSPALQMKAKREGIVSGILDMFVPAPDNSGQFGGLYIEFKKPKTGRVSPEQARFIKFLGERKSLHWVVYDSWQSAAEEVVNWLGLEKYAPIERIDLESVNGE